jgi:hypothetical protein
MACLPTPPASPSAPTASRLGCGAGQRRRGPGRRFLAAGDGGQRPVQAQGPAGRPRAADPRNVLHTERQRMHRGYVSMSALLDMRHERRLRPIEPDDAQVVRAVLRCPTSALTGTRRGSLLRRVAALPRRRSGRPVRAQSMHVSVQKSICTTCPRSSAGPSGSALSHPVARPATASADARTPSPTEAPPLRRGTGRGTRSALRASPREPSRRPSGRRRG